MTATTTRSCGACSPGRSGSAACRCRNDTAAQATVVPTARPPCTKWAAACCHRRSWPARSWPRRHSWRRATRMSWPALLPGLAAGTTLAAVAYQETPGGNGRPVRAVRDGTSWLLTGSRSFVLDGGQADLILVPAGTESGIALFAVDAAAARGLSRRPMRTLDRAGRRPASISRPRPDGSPARSAPACMLSARAWHMRRSR